jgi:hypothetical protein
MKGIIQDDGYILGEDKKIYEPDMLFETNKGLTVLLAATSWSRFHIDEVKGRSVEFVLSPKGKAYNFELIEN